MEEYYVSKQRAKENVDGPFYTIDMGCDCGCLLPEAEAPELLKTTDDRRHLTYFFKQPSTEIELSHAINAVNVCPIHDVRYGGKDPRIIKRIDLDQSDYILNKSGEVVLSENAI
jgi:hypothetical protein